MSLPGSGKTGQDLGAISLPGTQSHSSTPRSATGLLLWAWSVQMPRGGRCSARQHHVGKSAMARCGENQLHTQSAHPAHKEAWPMVLTVPTPLCEPWAEPQIPQLDTDLFPGPLCGPNRQGQEQWWARGGGYAKASAEGPEWETPSGNKGHNKPIGPVCHSPTGREKTTALAQEKSPLAKQSQPETRLRDASSSLLTGQLQACFWHDPVLRAMLPGLGC